MKSFLLLALGSCLFLSINCSENKEGQEDLICTRKCSFYWGYIKPLYEPNQEEIEELHRELEFRHKVTEQCKRKCFQKLAIIEKMLEALKNDNQ